MAASSFASEAPVSPVTAVPPEPSSVILATEAQPDLLTARAYVAFDVETGALLTAHREHEVVPIASVTKLLTAATVLRTLDLTATATISEADVANEGRAGRLSAGSTYTFYDLLFPLLLESSNDAAAVYERVTNGDLIRRMNAYAVELGAATLSVADTSGLSPENVASAHDLLVLTRSLYGTLPHLFDITQLSKRVTEDLVWVNNSPVLTTSYKGGKHGFTEAADRTLVALYDEEIGGEVRTVGYILLGSSDLKQDIRTLRSFVLAHASLR